MKENKFKNEMIIAAKEAVNKTSALRKKTNRKKVASKDLNNKKEPQSVKTPEDFEESKDIENDKKLTDKNSNTTKLPLLFPKTSEQVEEMNDNQVEMNDINEIIKSRKRKNLKFIRAASKIFPDEDSQ